MSTPFAKSYVKYRKIRHHTGGHSYTARDWWKIYGCPPDLDGSGHSIGFIELGGGFIQSDLDSYCNAIGVTSPQVKFVSVDGGTNSPSTPDSADGEVMLDLCVAAGFAPKAGFTVYGAPNSDAGFTNAILAAVSDGVDAISISWGGPEDTWSSNARNRMGDAFNQAKDAGITVTVAAGDNGSNDGESKPTADFPSSHPYVLSCGGTSLIVNGNTRTETVWNDGSNGGATGGGLSAYYSLPSYQGSVKVPGGKQRGVPDVAGDADPETGVVIIVDGQTLVLGGTSAVAPMWAGIVCLLNQGLGKRVGFLNNALYGLGLPSPAFNDITQGNNGTYSAHAGFDLCTGLGSPNVSALLAALGGGSNGGGGGDIPVAQGATITISADVKAGTYTLS